MLCSHPPVHACMHAGTIIYCGPHIIVALLEGRRSQRRYVVLQAGDVFHGIVQIVLCDWAVALRLIAQPLGVDIAAAEPAAKLRQNCEHFWLNCRRRKGRMTEDRGAYIHIVAHPQQSAKIEDALLVYVNRKADKGKGAAAMLGERRLRPHAYRGIILLAYGVLSQS